MASEAAAAEGEEEDAFEEEGKGNGNSNPSAKTIIDELAPVRHSNIIIEGKYFFTYKTCI